MNTENSPDPDSLSSEILVEISDTQSRLKIDHEALTQLICNVLHAEDVRRGSLSIAVVDDATIQAINRRHLGHDWPTDVISFLLSEPGDALLAGELIVSAEMAATTAAETEVPPWDELALYVVHGLLHLCGYDDLAPDDRDAMRRREGEVLARLGLSNTFPATSVPDPVGVWPDADRVGRESDGWTV